MGNKGHSERGFGGSINHYDEHGNKTGRSDPGLLGGYTNYDAKGNKTGHSDPSMFGGLDHYDKSGKKIGHSDINGLGGYTHYDSNGNKTGRTDSGYPGSYDHSEGCYIATCVYGSYNCPQVWILRRYRDSVLRKNQLGRLFVRIYYAVSPTAVKIFGNSRCFRYIWKHILDKKISRLEHNGLDNTPYTDKTDG